LRPPESEARGTGSRIPLGPGSARRDPGPSGSSSSAILTSGTPRSRRSRGSARTPSPSPARGVGVEPPRRARLLRTRCSPPNRVPELMAELVDLTLRGLAPGGSEVSRPGRDEGGYSIPPAPRAPNAGSTTVSVRYGYDRTSTEVLEPLRRRPGSADHQALVLGLREHRHLDVAEPQLTRDARQIRGARGRDRAPVRPRMRPSSSPLGVAPRRTGTSAPPSGTAAPRSTRNRGCRSRRNGRWSSPVRFSGTSLLGTPCATDEARRR